MKTLLTFAGGRSAIPATTAWDLDSLAEFRGKQELYTRQSPQKLRVLREHALIESAVSSNRIEDVTVAPSRVQSVLVASKPLFRDRDKEEVRGYQNALSGIGPQRGRSTPWGIPLERHRAGLPGGRSRVDSGGLG